MMRCPNCELPLSPTNTPKNCPRCQRPITVGSGGGWFNAGTQQATPQQNIEQGWGRGVQAPPFSQQQNASWGAAPAAQTQPWDMQQPQTPFYTPSPQPLQPQQSSQGQVWLPTPNSTSATNQQPFSFNPAMSERPPLKRPGRSNNVGFLIAGLCVFTGALLLVFVYFMAAGLPGKSSVASTGNTQATTAPTTVAQDTPTAAPSPTATPFPGQQYIDNAQMATQVDTNTGKVIQASTTFKVGSKMYVTFDLHPNGQTGAVCLNWFLNSNHVTDYAFAVTPIRTAGYSYAIYGSPGPAYVEISWASSKACSDMVLAQRVSFTVTN